MTHPETVHACIADAGGTTAVALDLGLAQSSVWKWTERGLPRTEWTGETNYAKRLVTLANRNPERSQRWSIGVLRAKRDSAAL